MLIKLLKYDLKYIIKNMSVFYILAIFFAVTTRILFSIKQTVMISIISRISVGCMFAMTANILINTIMRSWVRFRDSIYKDESYLTHTLPVTKNDIYNSKFIQTLIFFIIGFIIVIISLLITYYTKERWILLKGIIGKITDGLACNPTLLISGFLAVVFLEGFNAIQCGFLGIIFGYKRNNGKIGYSVLFGFLAYLISQNLVLGLVFVFGLFNKGIMDLFQASTVFDPESLKILLLLSIVLYVLIIGLMMGICKKSFNKGVNVE